MNKSLFVSLIILVMVTGLGWYAISASRKPADREIKDAEDAGTVQQMPATSSDNAEPGSSVHDLPVAPAAAAARKDLAAKLSVPEKSIVIMLVEEQTWSDGCLGLGKAHESCLQALVEGFRVEMQTRDKTYIYRTDKTGATFRQESEAEGGAGITL